MRDQCIQRKPSWLPALLLIPTLYAVGWLLTWPLIRLGVPAERQALIGTLISFLLLVGLLPCWARLRWTSSNAWAALGLSRRGCPDRKALVAALFGGLSLALILLGIVLLPVLLGSWGHWIGECTLDRVINALLLTVGVGLAEELIFRAWLWRELNELISPPAALLTQALVFSLVHTRFNLGVGPMLGLLIGLFLLGMALALQRRLDGGSLWGCVGLHGGLVGGWFLIQSGLVQLSPDAPAWLVGPGGLSPNPLGGLMGIGGLLLLLGVQLTAVARAARPETGARNAS